MNGVATASVRSRIPPGKRPSWVAYVAGALLALAWIGGAAAVNAETIRGTVIFRERMLLPPDAVCEVTLQDVSRADAPAEVLGRARLDSAGQVPIRFQLEYDPARLVEGRRYALRATISAGGRLLFTTTTVQPPPAAGVEAELVVQRVGAAQEARPDRLLVETYWKLFRCSGAPVAVVPGHPEAHIILKLGGQLIASGGCNRLTGSYQRDGAAILLGPVATTTLECFPGSEQEGAFLEAMRNARSYRIAGDDLDLLDADGKVVAEFTAVDLR